MDKKDAPNMNSLSKNMMIIKKTPSLMLLLISILAIFIAAIILFVSTRNGNSTIQADSLTALLTIFCLTGIVLLILFIIILYTQNHPEH
jgi:membrane protein YdbS with pleckstrin-like domain